MNLHGLNITDEWAVSNEWPYFLSVDDKIDTSFLNKTIPQSVIFLAHSNHFRCKYPFSSIQQSLFEFYYFRFQLQWSPRKLKNQYPSTYAHHMEGNIGALQAQQANVRSQQL